MLKVRRPRLSAPAATAAFLVACSIAACRGTEIEDTIAKISWFTNMRNQPAVEPYEVAPRPPPEGTVLVGAGVPLMATPDDYSGIPNPIPATDESLARGKANFDIFCAVCHGPEGRGGGSVEGPFPAGVINRLDTDRAIGRTDGYIFGIITASRGLMPSYRRLPQDVRWDIINYVRQLQASPSVISER